MGHHFQVTCTVTGDVATLSLSGRFDFSQYAVFKEEQMKLLERDDITTLVLDFRDLEYLDSAALGILLVLLDNAKERDKTVTIQNAHGVVREILDVAHFDRMFEIRD